MSTLGSTWWPALTASSGRTQWRWKWEPQKPETSTSSVSSQLSITVSFSVMCKTPKLWIVALYFVEINFFLPLTALQQKLGNWTTLIWRFSRNRLRASTSHQNSSLEKPQVRRWFTITHPIVRSMCINLIPSFCFRPVPFWGGGCHRCKGGKTIKSLKLLHEPNLYQVCSHVCVNSQHQLCVSHTVCLDICEGGLMWNKGGCSSFISLSLPCENK